MDPLVDRKNGKLIIKAVHAELHAEPHVPKDEDTSREIRDSVKRLSEFLGVNEIVYSRRVPRYWSKLSSLVSTHQLRLHGFLEVKYRISIFSSFVIMRPFVTYGCLGQNGPNKSPKLPLVVSRVLLKMASPVSRTSPSQNSSRTTILS